MSQEKRDLCALRFFKSEENTSFTSGLMAKNFTSFRGNE